MTRHKSLALLPHLHPLPANPNVRLRAPAPFDLHAELARLSALPRENPDFEPMSPEERAEVHKRIRAAVSFLK
ncbi:hypothetical protein [Deinococcus cellulosilyticus]|uniref:Uncharacterized protein n=1 Tax=Deinococcus cellulosilyticus (strain DSM 18568 / NBRC 106333 / KACC 11606 / 5516J-15) TaxID=1223518 RepID=A0A511NBS6_DEIC1|nr:hypothetical protein [Deinococcus cellulosilyticus]GEM50047.1 hypothetical protein DC3_56820 [Deinococcus cellulosilyticus NBRC 106333 = KACC 11606]